MGGLIITKSAGSGAGGGGVLVGVFAGAPAQGTVKSNVAIVPYCEIARIVNVPSVRPFIVQMRVNEPLCWLSLTLSMNCDVSQYKLISSLGGQLNPARVKDTFELLLQLGMVTI